MAQKLAPKLVPFSMTVTSWTDPLSHDWSMNSVLGFQNINMRQMVERVRGALIECADKMHDMFHSIKTADALYEVSVTP